MLCNVGGGYGNQQYAVKHTGWDGLLQVVGVAAT